MPRWLKVDDIDFARIVRPGDAVIWTQGAGEPVALVEKLLEQRHAIGPFSVFLGASYSGVVKPEHADVITFIGMGAVGTNRQLCAQQLMRVIPCHLSDLPHLMATGLIRIDVAIMQLSATANGRNSLGAVNGYVQFGAKAARTTIAEVNDQAPFTQSREIVGIDCFDFAVAVSRPLVEQKQNEPTATDQAIASNIANYIKDGDTLQIGIGAVPHALASVLTDRCDLGLHSGVVGDGILSLVTSGVITNARKSIDPGKSVTGGLAGTRQLFNYADRNPDLWLEPVTYTHSLRNLTAIDNLVSVNSAIEVDLTGQVGSETTGARYIGTIGGQNDFIRGALASRGGRSIIGLPSRSAKGVARIVPIVSSGIVTVPRSDADIVVTEHGGAELRGKTIRERVQAMVAIAHPEDRDNLLASGKVVLAGW